MSEQYLVKKINGPVDWTVEVPGSKSMTNRALLLAALSDGTVELSGVLFSDDSRHFLSSLQALGFEIFIDEERKWVRVRGCGGQIPRKEAEIYVGSAGTAARFLTAMLGFSDGTYMIQASEQMKKRPMMPLFELLEDAGARITYLEKEGFLPIRIRGRALRTEAQRRMEQQQTEQNRQNGDAAETRNAAECHKITRQLPVFLDLDISKSTQFLSALLLISTMIKQGLHIHITSEKTDGSYIRITRKMMEDFGVSVDFDGRDYEVPQNVSYRRERYVVEPDMSAACYFYGAAAITGGRALVKNVHSDNTQGDLKFLAVLEQMGCTVTEKPEGIQVQGPPIGSLKGITVDMNDFSDQALTLAAIAPFARDKVQIEHIGHIRLQESDRIHAIVTELSKLGIRCDEEPEAVTIYPGVPMGGVVETYEDHRVAMAFSLIGLRTEGIRIDNPDCCKKTFEEYFTVMDRLTGQNYS